MKKLLTLALVIGSLSVMADTHTQIVSPTTGYQTTEAKAVEVALAIEAKVKAGKFKSVYQNGFCEFGSNAEYTTQNVEMKKFYVDGKAQYVGVVNIAMECEEEYQM